DGRQFDHGSAGSSGPVLGELLLMPAAFGRAAISPAGSRLLPQDQVLTRLRDAGTEKFREGRTWLHRSGVANRGACGRTAGSGCSGGTPSCRGRTSPT